MTGASKSVAGAQSPSEARRLTAAPRGLYEAYGASEAIFTLENAASAPLNDHEDRNPSLGTEHVLFPRADTSPDQTVWVSFLIVTVVPSTLTVNFPVEESAGL